MSNGLWVSQCGWEVWAPVSGPWLVLFPSILSLTLGGPYKPQAAQVSVEELKWILVDLQGSPSEQ